MFVFVFFIFGILLGGLVVVFALQNVSVVTVHFFSQQIEGSLALILLITMVTGALAAYLTVLPETISSYFRHRKLKKENTQLREELAKQKELTHFAKKTIATEGDIARIEQGAIDDNRAV